MINVKDLVHKRIELDDGAQGLIILFFLSQLFFTNGIYLFLGMVCIWMVLPVLQQPLKPSIFTIIFLYHLIQIMAAVWQSNYLEKDLNFRSYHTDAATLISYVGLTVMFIPILYFQNKLPNITFNQLKKHAQKISIQKTFKVYLIGFFAANSLAGVAFIIPGLSQVIFSVLNLKWFLFLLFGFQVILKKQMVKEFIFFVLLEFSLGFFTFFSDFKTVMFFVGFLALTFIVRILLKHVLLATICIIALFYLGVTWTSVKGEYRGYLNQGSQSQAVMVGKEDALNKLIDLSSNQTEGSFQQAAADFFDRLQYTYHLAKTMDRVPAVLPYEYGDNIASIISFVTTPRFLNPNKPKLEATVKATKYTGIMYAGASKGVSFSLGYFADCYIDFGYVGMMIPLLALGFIFGGTYFYFVRKSSNNFIFNYAVVGAMFMEFTAFEMDGTYLMGRLFATLLTFFMVKLFCFPWLMRYLSLPANKPVASTPGENTLVS